MDKLLKTMDYYDNEGNKDVLNTYYQLIKTLMKEIKNSLEF